MYRKNERSKARRALLWECPETGKNEEIAASLLTVAFVSNRSAKLIKALAFQ